MHPYAPTDTNGSPLAVRHVTGPEAHELFVRCRPRRGEADAGREAGAVYEDVVALLASWGASLDAVVSETLFLGDVRRDLAAALDARDRVFREAGRRACPPVTTTIGQAPLEGDGRVEVLLTAIVPRGGRPLVGEVLGSAACGCAPCLEPTARVVQVGDQRCVHAGNIHGSGPSAFDEAYSMFCAAAALLGRAGMSFRDVVRTWLYLRDIDRDYDDLNRARRAFFREQGVDLRPASTGIGGAPFPDGHDFAMSLYALQSQRSLAVDVISAPTLNDPALYGADFSRGLRVTEANKVAVYLSGTASVDEAGRTAHPADFEAQVRRMLVNLSALLAGQGASFRDVVSAVSYVKRPADAPTLRAMFRDAGFDGFPNALVHAPICRPELLCEVEAVAALPLPAR